MPARRVGVLIIEDSLMFRDFLVDIVQADERLEVVDAVASAEQALRVLPQLRPDVISMDICLPGVNGVDATRRIMSEHPTPVVVVAADLRSEAINRSMDALRAGALSVVEKPSARSLAAYRQMSSHLCDQFFYMSQVRVIRRRSYEARPADAVSSKLHGPVAAPGRVRAVGMVASTGGPNALAAVLGELPNDFPTPILLVQHMGSQFIGGFARWLDSACRLEVMLAEHGTVPRPGVVYIAPAERHLILAAGQLTLVEGAPACGHRPSGDVLLQSLADLNDEAVGVVLTGMGEDGARGLLAMRRAGAHTIAQDEASAIVYGMPAAAARSGAALEQLPLEAIARRTSQLVGRTNAWTSP